jgi:hypothetical protein
MNYAVCTGGVECSLLSVGRGRGRARVMDGCH